MRSIIILATLFATSAHAGVAMPKTAKLLFQEKATRSGSGQASVAAVVQDLEQQIIDRVAGHPLYADDFTKPLNLEYECQAVYRKWSAMRSQSTGYVNNTPFYAGSQLFQNTFGAVNVYCQPRDFRQKVAISAMQACEKEPKPECMSKDYMDMFGKIQQTTYEDIAKP